ncbi:MAG: hypothetical protein V4684_15605 [Pseudomonadota bacterium]
MVFQGTASLTFAAIRAASVSALGTRGNPLDNLGSGLSIGLNVLFGVPFAVYSGYRTGIILANAAPQAMSGPVSRAGIRIAGFALVALVPLAAAASLAATVEAEEDDRLAEQVFELLAFMFATNARCAGQILRDTENHLSRGLMPIAVVRDRAGRDMADSPDYTTYHNLRLGLLLLVYGTFVFFNRQVGQSLLQDAFGLPSVRRGSFEELFGSSMGLAAGAAVVEGIDGVMGVLMQRLALSMVDASVTYRPASGEFRSMFNTRERALRSLDIIIVNGFMRTSFFYLVDPPAAFAARHPLGSAMRLGLQSAAVVPHTVSEMRGHVAQRSLAAEDRERMERERREFFSEYGVQYNNGEPSVVSGPSRQVVRPVAQPNSENVFDRDPDEVMIWNVSPMAEVRSSRNRRHSFISAVGATSVRIDSPEAAGEIPGRWLNVPPLEPLARASASGGPDFGLMQMHLDSGPVPAAAGSRSLVPDPEQVIERKIPEAPRREAPRKK